MDLLTGDDPGGERLRGGVSSDIWRIDLPSGPICVKRALEKLRVDADWHAPVRRNFYEARWMTHANAAVAGSAPHVLGQDEASGTLAMEYLPPDTHPVWKDWLHEGIAEPYFAAQVTSALSRIHEVSHAIAVAVAAEVFAKNLNTVPRPEDLPGFIRSQMFKPDYPDYTRALE